MLPFTNSRLFVHHWLAFVGLWSLLVGHLIALLLPARKKMGDERQARSQPASEIDGNEIVEEWLYDQLKSVGLRHTPHQPRLNVGVCNNRQHNIQGSSCSIHTVMYLRKLSGHRSKGPGAAHLVHAGNYGSILNAIIHCKHGIITESSLQREEEARTSTE